MPNLDDDTRDEVKERLGKLSGPVNLVYFMGRSDDGVSAQLAEVLEEVVALAGKATLEKHDLAADASLAYRYAIARAPAIVVESSRDYGIRYYGAPSGYEFETLLDVMLDVGRGTADVSPEVLAGLAQIDRPVHIQVFSTPT